MNFGTPAENAARVLRATGKVCYVPLSGSTGTATITYRAWDQTASLPRGSSRMPSVATWHRHEQDERKTTHDGMPCESLGIRTAP